jgi:nicotinamide riboside kinase
MANIATPGGLTIALVGAECSGKTTLAHRLAHRLGAPWVPEYARAYLAGRARYTQADVLAIARGQQQKERVLAEAGQPLLIADTDLIVVKIWWEVRFGGNDAWIDATLRAELAGARRRCYLVPRPDFPWVADPLRENPHDRAVLHGRYLALLDELRVPYLELTGSKRQRLETAAAAAHRWLTA